MACGLPFLVFEPVDDPLIGVPLIDMETGDFLDALPREHEDADRARVGRMHGSVGAYEPAVEAQKLFFIKPAGPHLLGLGGDAGRRIVDEPETALRHTAVIVF